MAIKKVWAWIKAYWYVPVSVITSIFLWQLFREDIGEPTKLLENAKESHKKEVKTLEKIRKESERKKDQIHKDYYKAVTELDAKYKLMNLTLHEWEKKKVEKIVKKTIDDPETRARLIAEEFGFEVVIVDD
tara:strand:+ start:5920 stop:6312 length:393 start_codon:yes stop_codon:yes gene_type:complete